MQLVSVIIPTHNRSSILKRAIESVQNQSYKNLEIIVIDDASQDDTEQIVKQVEDSRILYLKIDESHGANFARNFGVKHSHGKYVAFLDDDDEWMEEKVAKQVDVLENDDAIGLVYTQRKIINDENQFYYTHRNDVGDLSHIILMGNSIGTTSSVMVKRDIFDRVGGFDPEILIHQDKDLWIRIAQITLVGIVDEPLVLYNDLHSLNRISTSIDRIEKNRGVFEKKYKKYFDEFTPQELRDRRANKLMSNGEMETYNNNRIKATTYILHAMMISPSKRKAFELMTVFVPKKTKRRLKYYINKWISQKNN